MADRMADRVNSQPNNESNETFAAVVHSSSIRVPGEQRIRDAKVLKMGTDGTWLARRLILTSTNLFFLRQDDDQESIIDSIELVGIREVHKMLPASLASLGATSLTVTNSNRRSSNSLFSGNGPISSSSASPLARAKHGPGGPER